MVYKSRTILKINQFNVYYRLFKFNQQKKQEKKLLLSNDKVLEKARVNKNK